MSERRSTDDLSAELLERYLAGECSEAEAAAVRRRLMTDPALAHVLERYLAALDAESTRPRPPDTLESWASLRERLRQHSSTQEATGEAMPAKVTTEREGARRDAAAALRVDAPEPARPSLGATAGTVPSRRVRWRRGMTATIAAAAGVAGVLVYDTFRARETRQSHTYVTTQRQRADVVLVDGTRVHVAPASRLRVAADFGSDRRDVYLEGEAFFAVAHDAESPFTVYAGSASARDVGTAFSVRSYAQDSAVQVIVREGEVALSGVGRLGAGDVGLLHVDGTVSVRRRVNVTSLLGWIDGQLVFRDAPLSRVLEDLRRWYGVEVVLGDERLAALPFTGVLTDARSAEAVDLVAVTLGLHVRRAGARVVLDPVPGRTPRMPRRPRAPRR